MQMSDQELITALRRVAPETGSLRCLGCGYEYGCSLHGCLILRIAVDRLTELCAPTPNPPLTLEELREMAGEPVWLYFGPGFGEWVLVRVIASPSIRIFLVHKNGLDVSIDIALKCGGKLYRRKPEEDQS